MHYADSKTSYAIDYRLYLKRGTDGFQTKISLASIARDKFHMVEANGRKLRVYSKWLHIKSLGCIRRLIVSKEGKDTIFLLTNKRTSARKILVQYMSRWKIESFHKDAKQHLGLGKIQARNIVGIRRHWYLVFLAHSLLRLGAGESSFGRALIRTIGKKAKAACLQMLEEFMRWVVTRGDQEKLHEMVEAILYRQS
jgi:hypothetical protein